MPIEEAPASIQSWAQFPIFQAANEIVQMADVDTRRQALDKIPARIRPLVEAEVKRLWPMRGQP